MVWKRCGEDHLGLGTKVTCSGLGKHHGLGYDITLNVV